MRAIKTLLFCSLLTGSIYLNAQNAGVVGTLPGKISITSSGAAAYNIPIECPVGINGLQPGVSLTYNSQSGNDIAGYGWGLSAVSAITRTGSSRYYDGKTDCVKLSGEDNLEWNGERLV